jgi:UDP-glucose 4-epimerase
MKKATGRHYTDGKSNQELIGHIGFGEPVEIDSETEKKVLITGAGSYIGETFRAYAEERYPALKIDAVDMIDGSWREKDFSEYDIVYHVAGIAHADVGNVDEVTKAKYYLVNTDLAVEVCEKAKSEGVKEFIFMSSMIVYGDSAPYGKSKIVDEHTVPVAANFYGDSKLQADVAVRSLADDNFKVVVLRPPMIYGRGSKGNYPTLAKLARKLPVFPDVNNQRSMLYIDNLCEFLCQIMLIKEIKENAVVLIPQNAEWTKTTDMVKEIATVSGKKIRTLGIMKPAVLLGAKVPGKIGGLVNKAFGNSCYAHEISAYLGINYQIVNLDESINRAEGKKTMNDSLIDKVDNEMVSIIMPAYNCSDFILEAVESVKKQTYSNWELLIVDDCSTDNTLSIINNLAEKDKRIIVLQNEKNLGAAASRNKAVEYANGRYIAFLDSDDVWKKTKLSKQLSFMRENNYAFTCTSYGKINEKSEDLKITIFALTEGYEGLLKRCPGNSTVIYDSHQIGKFKIPLIRKRNDYVMWLQVIKKAGKLYGFDEILSYHRIGMESSISANKFSLVKYHWIVYRDIEQLSFIKSAWLCVFWISKSIFRFQ